ncbi:uncharacterized protein [Miscanthus floridulus]|uniref:uncharacterized protein isoform X2 n=1 Tax=Miscanthus floridulus TaxID=154761 RepID=UPI00345957E3
MHRWKLGFELCLQFHMSRRCYVRCLVIISLWSSGRLIQLPNKMLKKSPLVETGPCSRWWGWTELWISGSVLSKSSMPISCKLIIHEDETTKLAVYCLEALESTNHSNRGIVSNKLAYQVLMCELPAWCLKTVLQYFSLRLSLSCPLTTFVAKGLHSLKVAKVFHWQGFYRKNMAPIHPFCQGFIYGGNDDLASCLATPQ